MSKKRPFGVTLLLWLVLSLSAWGLVRFLAALRLWNILNEFGARLSPLYLAITGAGWALVGVFLLWSLFSGKLWTHWAVSVSIFLWLAGYWIERIFFESPRQNLFFALIVSLLLLAVTWSSAFNRKTREFFIRSEEHEQPNQNTETA